MNAVNLIIMPRFPEDDFAWLSAQAQQRGLEIYQFIDQIIQTHMPNGFHLNAPMSETEATEEFARQLRVLVRSLRVSLI